MSRGDFSASPQIIVHLSFSPFHENMGTCRKIIAHNLRIKRGVMSCGRPLTKLRNVCPFWGPSSNVSLVGVLKSRDGLPCADVLLFAGPRQQISPVAKERSSSHSASGSGGKRLSICLTYHLWVMLITRLVGIGLPQLFSAGIFTFVFTLAEILSNQACCF